ncbi:MAG: hypothetical protein K5694_05630 [Bacilli bacterium]|nr:hypothetical protein [Bacilli bacterium]
MRNNPLVVLIYRAVVLAIALFSSVIPFFIYNINGVTGGNITPFIYFTNWSVWLVLVAAVIGFIYALRNKLGKSEGVPSWVEAVRLAAFIMILATFIISAFVLPAKIWMKEYWTLASTFKHFLLPVVFIFDAIVLSRKQTVKWTFPLFAVIPPLIYWIIIIARFMIKRGGNPLPQAIWADYYPYGFTNIDNGHSLGGLIGLLGGILVGLLIVGYAYYIWNHFENGKLTLKKGESK